MSFDAAKESRHIMSLGSAWGGSFKLLGITFDGQLSMSDAVEEVVSEASWKLRTLLRTKRYYTDADLITLYKAHLLSYIEYRTPAIYHATQTVLSRLDEIQPRFLKDAGVDEVTALVEFHLAPLPVRRDIAMLGLIHRTALGKGPPHFSNHFRNAKGTQQQGVFQDPHDECAAPLIKRSVFGLVAIYNSLPQSFRKVKSLPAFQGKLQEFVIARATAGCSDWVQSLCPRQPMIQHPVMSADSCIMDI